VASFYHGMVVKFCYHFVVLAAALMIQCDVQGSDCKICYHGDCVCISKSCGKRMERDMWVLFTLFVLLLLFHPKPLKLLLTFIQHQ